MADANLIKYRLYRRDSSYYVAFNRNGKRCRKSLGTLDPQIAESRAQAHVAAAMFATADFVSLLEMPDGASWSHSVANLEDDGQNWLSRMYRSVRGRGQHTKIACTISFRDLKEVAIQSGGVCAVTRTPLVIDAPRTKRTHPLQPSLDRIQAGGPYSASNVRLVCYAANLAMNEWGEGVLMTLLAHLSASLMREQRHVFATVTRHSKDEAA